MYICYTSFTIMEIQKWISAIIGRGSDGGDIYSAAGHSKVAHETPADAAGAEALGLVKDSSFHDAHDAVEAFADVKLGKAVDLWG